MTYVFWLHEFPSKKLPSCTGGGLKSEADNAEGQGSAACPPDVGSDSSTGASAAGFRALVRVTLATSLDRN